MDISYGRYLGPHHFGEIELEADERVKTSRRRVFLDPEGNGVGEGHEVKLGRFRFLSVYLEETKAGMEASTGWPYRSNKKRRSSPNSFPSFLLQSNKSSKAFLNPGSTTSRGRRPSPTSRLLLYQERASISSSFMVSSIL